MGDKDGGKRNIVQKHLGEMWYLFVYVYLWYLNLVMIYLTLCIYRGGSVYLRDSCFRLSFFSFEYSEFISNLLLLCIR